VSGTTPAGILQAKEPIAMNLNYAVERLLDTGWTPAEHPIVDLERLPDGRPYPTIEAVRREFAEAGLDLSLKQNFMFSCCRATWAPAGESIDPDHAEDDRHGTVVGSCEKEAAVYALAQLRASLSERQFVGHDVAAPAGPMALL
jgi:hypothetical protein